MKRLAKNPLRLTMSDETVFHCENRCVLSRAMLSTPELPVWLRQIDAKYCAIESARKGGMEVTSAVLPEAERFVPTASSFTIGAALSAEDIKRLVWLIAGGKAARWIREQLGERVGCDLDQSWIRRQYAPGNYPRFHAPHGWHQDGALGFNFLAHGHAPFPPDALLRMVTCWIALGDCGRNAPGLEIVTTPLEDMATPIALADPMVRARFAPEEFWRPELRAGDALLFRGNVLHRTHVTPEMTRDRTSIEVRLFPAPEIPARLEKDRFVEVELRARVTTETSPASPR